MNVLVIGNGGREHAIVAALAKSPKVGKLYCMKGNAGIAELAECVNVDYMDNAAVGDWQTHHLAVGIDLMDHRLRQCGNGAAGECALE